MFGPLVFEEKEPHVAYDRDYALVLDDLLPGAPRPLDEENRGGGMMRGRMMGAGMMGRAMMGGGGMRRMLGMPEYEAFLIRRDARSPGPGTALYARGKAGISPRAARSPGVSAAREASWSGTATPASRPTRRGAGLP